MVTNVNITNILDQHVINDATFTMSICRLPDCDLKTDTSKQGYEARDRGLTEIVAYDEKTTRVVYFCNENQLAEEDTVRYIC